MPDEQETLTKAEEAMKGLQRLRSASEFTDEDVKVAMLQEAIVAGIEALYYQNVAIIELLKGGK